jgi:hypothetical protein
VGDHPTLRGVKLRYLQNVGDHPTLRGVKLRYLQNVGKCSHW